MNHRWFVFIACALLTATLFSQEGCGSDGSSGSATPPSGSPAGSAPASIVAVAGNGVVTLSWKTVTGAASYNLYMATQSGVSKSNYADLTTGVTSPYTRAGLANDTTYYFVITAKNGAGESGESTEVSAKPVSGTSSTVTISGKVLYEDKEYGLNGFTGNTTYKPVRLADVEVVGAAITGKTGTDGTYSLIVSSHTSSTVYLRVTSSATVNGTPAIEIKDLSGILYALPGDNFTPSGDSVANISIPAASPAGGAFNILDIFTSGFYFVHNLTGSVYPPHLSAYWQTGNQLGTWFCVGSDFGCPQGDGIYVLGGYSDGSGDTDHYDDDVLLHEFGHFIAASFSLDESPGGAHSLSGNDLDLRLSWSEGWGDFFPGAVKSWLNTTDPNLLSSKGVSLTQYIDTVGTGAGIAFDMGDPSGSSFLYSSNEVAVAKVLLDLRSAFLMQSVWDVIADFKTNPPATPVNLELFWDRWHSTGEPTSSLYDTATISSIFAGRSIKYELDSFEPDDVLTSTYTQPQVMRTLYSGGDIDNVVFGVVSGRKYTITTSNLKSGADTYLELYSSASQTAPIASNDNSNNKAYSYPTVPSNSILLLCDDYGVCHENGYDILGSTISFTAPVTGTYYVKIFSSPFRPVSAGRYGAYTLTITSP